MLPPASLLSEATLLLLACLPIVYGVRTLMRMRGKTVYPLLRARLHDGSSVPVGMFTIKQTSLQAPDSNRRNEPMNH